MPEPIHIAITRTVHAGQEAAFEAAMLRFFQRALDTPGTMGAHLLRPLPGSGSRDYGILRSFENDAARAAFYASDAFAAWERDVAPFVEGAPARRTLHGLEAFFRGGAPPPRWKMALVTWFGVFPAVAVWSRLLAPRLTALPSLGVTAVITACVVATLAWAVMPLLTRLFASWLRGDHTTQKEHSS